MTPRRTSTFRQIEFLRLTERRVLLIIVTPDGDVQNRILPVDKPYTPLAAGRGRQFPQPALRRPVLRSGARRLQGDLAALRNQISQLMDAAIKAGSEAAESNDPVFISGERNLLGVADLAANMDRCARCSICSSTRPGSWACSTSRAAPTACRSTSAVTPDLVPLDEMSVVAAPYEVDGKVVGTLGVIGPTRMAYERVIPIVDITARLLSNALSRE